MQRCAGSGAAFFLGEARQLVAVDQLDGQFSRFQTAGDIQVQTAFGQRLQQGGEFGAPAIFGDVIEYAALVVVGIDSAHDIEAVSALVRSVNTLVQQIDAQNLWGGDEVLLSAGGSAVFDLVIPMLKTQVKSRPVQGVLRSGCYVTHDHWNYARYLKLVEAREGLSASLQPALEVWAKVQSVPEPGLAILSAGRRDLSFDQCMPMPVRWAARGQSGEGAMQATPESWKVKALSDQHAHMVFDADGVWPQVGDRVALGISHPCTTFDKWRWMAVIEDDGRISGAISTHF